MRRRLFRKIFWLVPLLCAGCFQPLVPENNATAVIGFRRDSGIFNEWDVGTGDYRVDSTDLGWRESSKKEIAPGRHLLSFTWEIQSTGDDDDHGLTLLTTKSGTCDTWIDALAGRGYIVGAEVESGGSWVSEPRVKVVVKDGATGNVIGENACVYRHRGLSPAIM